jgi:hypothetical protein
MMMMMKRKTRFGDVFLMGMLGVAGGDGDGSNRRIFALRYANVDRVKGNKTSRKASFYC